MNIKDYVLRIVIISIIIIGIGIFFYIENNNDILKNNDISFSQCNNLSENEKESCIIANKNCTSDSCFAKKARLKQDESLCFNLSTAEKRSRCSSAIKHEELFERAVISDSVSVCSNFSQTSKQRECRDNYYFAKSVNSNNKTYCNNIEQEEIQNACNER